MENLLAKQKLNIDFSVLIGVYSGDNPNYFMQAMDSILNQTIKSNDIVLAVDGPLGDELLSVVNEYVKDYPEIHPVWLPENIGQGRSFNQVLPKCENEIVFRMDADDISMLNRFEVQLNFLMAHPEIKLLSSTISEFTNDLDNIITVRRVPATNSEIIKMAKHWSPINHPSAVFYKTAVIAVGSYQDFYRYEDYYLWLRMLAAGYQAANIQESLLYYRLSTENLNRRRNWPTTKSAIRFYLWKHKIGFGSWFDTLLMIFVMLGTFIAPNFIFEYVYKKVRK